MALAFWTQNLDFSLETSVGHTRDAVDEAEEEELLNKEDGDDGEEPLNEENDDRADDVEEEPVVLSLLPPKRASKDAVDLIERQKRTLRRLGHLDKKSLRVEGPLPTKLPTALRK